MAAPDLPTLFDFEGQFETAAQSVLSSQAITSFISQEVTSGRLPLINTGIGLDVGPALDVLTQLPPPATWPADQAPPQEYFRFPGNLEFRIEVPRDMSAIMNPNVPTLFRQIRGKLRAAMMRSCAPFTAANLPWYVVTDIKPGGASTGWELQRNLDYCSLRWAVWWSIRPDAWPVWNTSAP